MARRIEALVAAAALLGLGAARAHEVGAGPVTYVRESIVNPSAKVVSGFPPIMPTFQDLVTEERLLELIEYVKSLKGPRQVPTR